MLKLAMYLRISKDDSYDESESISNQREIILDYIRTHKDLQSYEIKEYIDDGFTGSNFNRPAFQRLMEDAKSLNVNCIVIKDTSRFGRDYLEIGNYMENIFPFLDIRFISVNDNYDSATHQDRTCTDEEMQFKNLMNDYYSKELSEKMRKNIESIKNSGRNPNWTPPFGYIKDKDNKYGILIDKKTAPIVCEIFELLSKGYTCPQVAKILNEKNYITPATRKDELGIMKYKNLLVDNNNKHLWTGVSVNKISKNEFYTGDYIYNVYRYTKIGGRKKEKLPESEWKRINNMHPAIINRDIFKKVRSLIEKRNVCGTKTRVKGQRLLSKKVVCGVCNSTLHLMIKYKNLKNHKKTYRYYRCERCRRNQKNVSINENSIFDYLVNRYSDNITKKETIDVQTIYGQNVVSELEREIKNIERKLQCLYDDYKFSKISKEKYLTSKEDLLSQRARITAEIEKQKKNISISDEKHDDISLIKQILDNYVDVIIVNKDKSIEIKEKLFSKSLTS